MKTSFPLLALCLLASTFLFSQNTNIQHPTSVNTNGNAPDASAILDVQATDKGVLIPRLTTMQRTSILTPATGLLVFDTGANSFWFFDGTDWADLSANIIDADGDTKIQVEASQDEDIIRFGAGGVEKLLIFTDSAVFMDRLHVEGKFVSGNNDNFASGTNSFVAGGNNNEANGNNSFVGAGFSNEAAGSSSFVSGGSNNVVASGAATSFIGGGFGHTITAGNSFIGAGTSNDVTGANSFIGGGTDNEISGFYSFIGGGLDNIGSGFASFIGGGLGLLARSNSETVFGRYNTDYSPLAPILANPADRLFVIGNGIDESNRSNALTVLKNGFVGIGEDIPTRALDVSGELFVKEENGVAYFQSSTSNSFIALENNGGSAATNVGYFDDGTDDYFFVDTPGAEFGELIVGTNGKTGIGRIPVTNRLEVKGNASKSSSGNWLSNSDARLKTNIRPLDSEAILEKMLSLQGITYEWDDDVTGSDRPEGTMYGFTAQNIQEVFPELVEEDNLGYLQTAYGTYDAMTVEAMRALYEEIENGKWKMQNLEAENQKQRTEISMLQSQLSEMEEVKSRLAQLEAALLGEAGRED